MSHCGFILYFSDDQRYRASFQILRDHLELPFLGGPFGGFQPLLKIELLVIFILICMSLLCILDMCPLLDIHIAYISYR